MINALLVSTEGGLDQSASPRNRTQFNYVDDGFLDSSRGVIFPSSHRMGVSSDPRVYVEDFGNH
jgi:hypothetical protein